ncbi:MAG TPA: amidohydrolase [Planctomycetes bacterium]|nr:amidohydrolase [Planctomycetota bacterium]
MLALAPLPAAQRDTPPADLVLRGGKIVTLDDDFGTVEALAVRGDRIAALGSDEEIAPWIDTEATRVIELEGRLVVPGFIEGHGHFTGLGRARQMLDLSRASNWDEIVAMVADAAAHAEPGVWILGRGWHQEKWDRRPEGAVEGFPTHRALSAASPDNPVCLTHASGHACFFNAKAMELAGVDASTEDPEGGEILTDESGVPTGVFRERAMELVARVYAEEQAARSPEQLEADLRRAIQIADAECLSKGITSFQDAGSSFETLAVMRKMAVEGELGVRLWAMVRAENDELRRRLAEIRTIGLAENHFTVRAVKRSIDGALGSRGAWLLAPYADAPNTSGLETSSVESITETARICAANDFQLCVHAIGDRANRETLDLFERVFEKVGRGKGRRWRIEHAQHLAPSDIGRFAELGVIASMQTIHCTSDAPYVLARLGAERAEAGAYVWRKLLDSGTVVSNGTDTPVEDVDPIPCFTAAVTRRCKDGTRFFPSQRMTRMEALRSYTLDAAYAAFEEDLKGSLTPGKLADIVILSQDLLTVPEDRLLETSVVATIVGGRVVWEAE